VRTSFAHARSSTCARFRCACAQADALSERATALERRALYLSCDEADELARACAVLGGAPCNSASDDVPPVLPPPEQRTHKRKQPSEDTQTPRAQLCAFPAAGSEADRVGGENVAAGQHGAWSQ
jgi:hypothetical protein